MRASSSAFFTLVFRSATWENCSFRSSGRRRAVRFPSLQSRDFRLLLAGQAVSLSGSNMQQVAVVWQLYLLTGSPLSLGLLGLFRVTPILLLAIGGGVAADALDRRMLMFAHNTG